MRRVSPPGVRSFLWCLLALAFLVAPDAGAQCPGPQPELEPNNTTATATSLTVPAIQGSFFGVPGAIQPAGDVDVFRITVAAGTRLWASVDTGGTQQGGANSRDSVLQVLAPDGTTLLEQDDDDGTGNGRTNVITSGNASVIANLPLPTAGTYFVRVSGKTPADVIAPYVLMVALSSGTQPEIEPNDLENTPFQTPFPPVAGTLGAVGDVDWYIATVLDNGLPFVVVDGDPERDGTTTDVVLTFSQLSPFPMPPVDSSTGRGAPPPGAEGVVLPFIANVRVSGPAAGSYAIAVFYSIEGCGVPVTLHGFEVR